MMHTYLGYIKLTWDRLMEALIDPENREACGRIVTEPVTDVNLARKNVDMVKAQCLEVKNMPGWKEQPH